MIREKLREKTMADSTNERWYAAHYDAHGELILSGPMTSPTAVGSVIDKDPARYRERLAVVERGSTRTLAYGRQSPNGVYEFKLGPRLP
jgi:hypothetical protein